jgi:ATP/maltotriose-dependent transcriptional regulator MalT
MRATGPRLAFRHQLVRDAVYRAISAPRRAGLHRRVLAALSQTGVANRDASVLAHHAAEAGDAEAVLRYAPAAARRAAALRAHREARAQYARLPPYLGGLLDDRRAELLDAYATECTIVDRFAEGAVVRREAVELWRRLGRQERAGLGLSLLAQAELGMGREAEALAANDEAIGMLEPLGPSLELARAYWYAAVIHVFAGDTRAATAWGTRSIELCRSLDEPSMLANAHNVVGGALLASGREAGREHLARSLALGRELELPELVADVHTTAGIAATASHRFEEAVRELSTAVAVAIEHDHDNIRHSALASLALALLHLGRWDEAADAALSVTARPHVSVHARISALVVLGRLRARRGDPDAGTVLDEALELARQNGSPWRALSVRAARAEAAVLAGDAGGAREEAAAALAVVTPSSQPWLVGELAYWSWVIGELDGAPEGAAVPFALQIDGRAAEAALAWDRLGCPYEAARARTETGRPDVVRQALDAFAELGARPATALAARQLRELGVRGVPRGPRPDTLRHPAMLTRREWQVLALLAQGLRNREIAARHAVSTRTVDHQVSSLLAKLRVRSRTEAVAEAHRLDLLPQDGQDDTAT